MFIPLWLFIFLAGFGCWGFLVFINSLRKKNPKKVTPHIIQSWKSIMIVPHCKTCSGYNNGGLARCYNCTGSKWALDVNSTRIKL